MKIALLPLAGRRLQLSMPFALNFQNQKKKSQSRTKNRYYDDDKFNDAQQQALFGMVLSRAYAKVNLANNACIGQPR